MPGHLTIRHCDSWSSLGQGLKRKEEAVKWMRRRTGARPDHSASQLIWELDPGLWPAVTPRPVGVKSNSPTFIRLSQTQHSQASVIIPTCCPGAKTGAGPRRHQHAHRNSEQMASDCWNLKHSRSPEVQCLHSNWIKEKKIVPVIPWKRCPEFHSKPVNPSILRQAKHQTALNLGFNSAGNCMLVSHILALLNADMHKQMHTHTVRATMPPTPCLEWISCVYLSRRKESRGNSWLSPLAARLTWFDSLQCSEIWKRIRV